MPALLKVFSANELNLAMGFNKSDGYLYFNYKGGILPVKVINFCDGMGYPGIKTKIAASDLIINGVSVKEKLGI